MYTIVTCFYRTDTKKHTLEEYEEWMSNMLFNIETPMVIFTELEFKEKIETLREGKPTQIYIIPFEKLKMIKYKDYWEHDFQRDTENSYHSIKLYVLWNEKTNFVNAIVNINPFDTDFYCWCDIGLFRNKETISLYKHWPNKKILETTVHDKIYLLNVFPFQDGELNILSCGLTKKLDRINRIGAGVILGHKDVWSKWTDAFYGILEKYMENNYFSGKDQQVMLTTYALHPTLVKLIQPTNEYYRKHGADGAWFYLRDFFL